MNYQCYSWNCLSNPIGYCLCDGVPITFCVLHLVEHLKITRDHRIFDFVDNPLSDFQKNLLKIRQCKICLKNTKKSILSESSKLLKLINNFTQTSQIHLDKLIKECDKVIRATLQVGNTQAINRDICISKYASDQILKSSKEKKDKIIENYGALQNLIKETLDCSKLNLYEENEIMFFRNKTKELISLNLDSLENQLKEQNNLPENISS